jgi:hypothetical protein
MKGLDGGGRSCLPDIAQPLPSLSQTDDDPQRDDSKDKSERLLRSRVSYQNPSIIENPVLNEKQEEHAEDEHSETSSRSGKFR